MLQSFIVHYLSQQSNSMINYNSKKQCVVELKYVDEILVYVDEDNLFVTEDLISSITNIQMG